jgi:hypothetical protein
VQFGSSVLFPRERKTRKFICPEAVVSTLVAYQPWRTSENTNVKTSHLETNSFGLGWGPGRQAVQKLP